MLDGQRRHMPSNIEQLRELRKHVERLHRKSIGMVRIAELVRLPPSGARRHLSLRDRKLRRDDPNRTNQPGR